MNAWLQVDGLLRGYAGSTNNWPGLLCVDPSNEPTTPPTARVPHTHNVARYRTKFFEQKVFEIQFVSIIVDFKKSEKIQKVHYFGAGLILFFSLNTLRYQNLIIITFCAKIPRGVTNIDIIYSFPKHFCQLLLTVYSKFFKMFQKTFLFFAFFKKTKELQKLSGFSKICFKLF